MAMLRAACTLASSVTSQAEKRTRAPSAPARASPPAWFRSAITALAPAPTNSRTQAAPRPELPPEIKKVWPLTCMVEIHGAQVYRAVRSSTYRLRNEMAHGAAGTGILACRSFQEIHLQTCTNKNAGATGRLLPAHPRPG